ncbi:hypothetical protein P8452_38864 [Trifolium repens]|nr:hypothetical protein P8452_38864 [Trifolium repens]
MVMDPLLYYSLLSLSFILTLKLLLQKRNSKNLPPSPLTLPIIGNFHNIDLPLHRSLQNLSQKYGNIFTLWLGSRRVVVISSQTLIQQCLTKHDIVLSNRARFLTGKHLFYNYTSLLSAPHGDHSRNIRRIITNDVLSTERLKSFAEMRRKETLKFITKLAKDTCEEFTRVELRTRLTNMTFEIMTRMVAGDAKEMKKFKDMINEMMPLLGANNMGDFVPLIRFFDFGGLVKRMKDVAKKGNLFLQGIIDEIRSERNGGNNMLQHLLTLQKSQPEYYSDVIIKGIIQGMFLAGTDTSAMTLEWAMSALLNHPHILKKAKDEIDTQIGYDRLVDESDISNLPYLQNIIYETLRFYPVAPLLLPRFTSDKFIIEGFTIPRDTIVMINGWAIQRDPKTWSDASCFKPERFEIEGEANKLIAFGFGRRACPGLGLAHRTMGLSLGLLIQCFEWKRLTQEKVDMTESKIGLVMEKLNPLETMCKARPIIKKVIQELNI